MKRKQWFDMETRRIVSEDELEKLHVNWIVNRVLEDGSEYALKHPEDYTLEAYTGILESESFVPVYDVENGGK